MPVYEYACMDCKKVVSVLVKRIGDKSKRACPKCGGSDMHRLINDLGYEPRQRDNWYRLVQ